MIRSYPNDGKNLYANDCLLTTNIIKYFCKMSNRVLAKDFYLGRPKIMKRLIGRTSISFAREITPRDSTYSVRSVIEF